MMSAAGMASAVQYTWDLGQLGTTLGAVGAALSFASTPTGRTLKVTAYETTNDNGTGKLIDAAVQTDGSWGLGVKGSADSGYPDTYTVDNAGRDEVLVFDAGVDNFDWTSLKLGFIATGTGLESAPDLKYWAGNGTGTGFDFNNYCLLASSCTGTVLNGSAGFGSATTLTDMGTTARTLTTGNKGRYLVVSGELSTAGGFEKFKISSTGGASAPEPQSIALIAIGLLAMFGIQRRAWPLRRSAFA